MPPTSLRRGARGSAVRRLQEALRAVGLDPGPIDGVFGRATAAAVRLLQKDGGLAVDGIVGPRTWEELEKRSSDGGPPKGTGDRTSAAEGAGLASLSEAGATFIAQFEGFRGTLYNDAAGHATIGFGHLVHKGKINGSEPAEFKAGISRERALEILKDDAAEAATAVSRSVSVELNQAQFDALVSFVFNLGAGNLAKSTLLRKLNAGDYDAVPSELARWNKAGGRVLKGLTRRRQAEGRLFSTGQYS